MPPTRRLPVLQNAPPDEDRPAWHWAVIGVVFIFSIWAPLAMLSGWIAGRVSHDIVGDLPPNELSLRLADASAGDRFWLWFALTVAPILAYAVACAASGALVGRFGGKAGPREAAVAGAVAALVGAGLTLLRASASTSAASLIVLLPVGVGAAWLGGTLGKKRRPTVV
jgi:tRNA-(ms[2]io[6]A)-hydroxylase